MFNINVIKDIATANVSDGKTMLVMKYRNEYAVYEKDFRATNKLYDTIWTCTIDNTKKYSHVCESLALKCIVDNGLL